MAEWITAIAALIAALATVAYLVATILIFREEQIAFFNGAKGKWFRLTEFTSNNR